MELNELRKTAEAATPGPWEKHDLPVAVANSNFTIHAPNAVGVPTWTTALPPEIASTLKTEDAEHVATFNPETVLALLSRLEQAEQDAYGFRKGHEILNNALIKQGERLEQAEQDRDAALEANKRWAHRSSRETSALRKANDSIARVRALRNTWCDASYDPMNTGLSIAGTVNAIDRALDGDR